MFMRSNRAKNGAPQPEATASSDASDQKAAKKLAPNFEIGEKPDDWRFSPSMETCSAINENHYQGGISGAGPYGKSYEKSIPSVGGKPVHDEGDRKLKS